MRQLWACLKPYLKAVGLAIVCMTIDVVAEIWQPMLMADIVGEGIETANMPFILRTGGLMLLLALVAIAAGLGNARCSSLASVGFAANLRESLFRKVQKFSFENIDDFSTASLSTRLTNDVTQLQNTVFMGMRVVVRAPMMLIFATFMALRLSVSLSAALLVAMPLLLFFLGLIMSRALPRFQAVQACVDGVNRDVQENMTNIRVVKSFVREDFEMKKFRVSNEKLMDATMRAMNLVIFNMPLMMLVMNACIMAVLWIGGGKAIYGEMDVASLVAFINYITMILMSLMMISMVFIMLTRASASYKRVREVLLAQVTIEEAGETDGTATQRDGSFVSSVEETQKNRPSVVAEAPCLGRVEFRDVSFKYHEDQSEWILKDVSFTAEPGQVVAVIGGTGAGKTSLVQLIPRFYDVNEGQVLVDGRDVREYPLRSLRQAVGMVLQKNTLFSGSVRDNLKWGKEDATDEEIRAAAECAQAHDFIQSFSEGYDTWIEQGGVNVSGGQKQRLCIARAMLKKPPILILDDSTSAVDTATEARIRQALDRQLADTTTFIIAQRISSVMDADMIIVMDDGRIVGQGTHEELLKSCREYREIYESQQGRKEAAS